jgi:Methylase involved in ubiquinone/menaquinone biosynthesis
MDFNQKAKTWDTVERINRSRILAEEIIKTIPIQKHFHALEFGCGTGLISFQLMNQLEHITLTDTSEGMITILMQKIDANQITNMSTILGDINEHPELLPKKYDLIYTSMVLHHILDVDSTLQNLYNQLNENGYLCIIDLVEEDGSFHKSDIDFQGHNGFNQDNLSQLLTNTGFHNVNSHVFYHDVKSVADMKINYSLFIMTGKK